MNFLLTGIGFSAALMMSWFFMPVAIRLSNKLGAMDKPDERKLHDNAIPVLGGIVIFLTFIICFLVLIPLDKVFQSFMAGLLVIFITGLVDDIWHLNPLLKFTGEITSALLFILMSDISIISFGDLVGTGSIYTGKYAIPVTVFCMVGVMNALNFADGLDGLAGGISAIACIFLACFAWLCGSFSYLLMLLILLGSLLGFLYFNRYPAKIFMGDTGSLVLGYILSAICILLVQKTHCSSPVLPVSMAIVMGLPIVDALVIMANRILHGRNPFSPDNSHLHHRLLLIGFSHEKTVLVVYLMMSSCGILALFIRPLLEWVQFTIGVVYASLLFGSVYILNFKKYKLT